MSNPVAPHPDPEMLIRLAEEDLSRGEAEGLNRHLAECGECRRQFEQLKATLEGYLQFHEQVLKAGLPAPPREWQLQLPRTPAPPNPVRAYWPWLRWAALAAATVVLMILLVRRLGQAPPVDAAELLRKATVAEQQAPRVNRRIRIRSRGYTWDRPARLTEAPSGEAARIKGMLDEAGYNSEDPLNPQSFSLWRSSLPEKRDEVSRVAESYVVRTSTNSGVLSDASLTLAVADLHAIACHLQFRSDETIDVTELPAEQPASSATPAIVHHPDETGPKNEATPSTELRVMAALHGIAADLGEPIEVTRDAGAVRVRATGLTQHREEELRTALAAIPGVKLEFPETPSASSRPSLEPRRGPARVEPTNPLIAELRRRLSDPADTGLADRLMDQTDNAMERAYALRSLARRFPSDAADQWAPSDRSLLAGLLRDHAEQLASSIAAIRRLLAPVMPADQEPPASPSLSGDWRAIAEGLPASLQQLDRLLNAPSGAETDMAARKLHLAHVLADVQKQAAGLRDRSPQ